MIINVAHTKGGVGKSTLATNLAIELQIPIVDLDMQKSSFYFNEIREKTDLKIIAINEERDIDSIRKYKGDPDHHILIDSGGMDNNINRKALVFSDLIITPVSISQVEFLGLEQFIRILQKGNLQDKIVVLLNNVNPRSLREIAEAREIITGDYKMKMFETIVGNRKVFKTAFSEGKSVFEMHMVKDTEPSISAARSEIKNLISEIRRIIHAN